MYGYDCNGYNQNGFDQWRYCKVNGHYQPINERGFFWNGENSANGYLKVDVHGYDISGFNEQGIHFQTGTKYDLEGYDFTGYNIEGYNRKGFSREGINKITGTKVNLLGYNEEGRDSWQNMEPNVYSIGDFAKVFGDIESENELNGKQKNKSM